MAKAKKTNTSSKKNSPKEQFETRGIQNITVRGARTHNLKNIDVTIPRNTMTIITGLSGSGKSSLAFDTIFAEGQRRYVESLSAYARQFLKQMPKPQVDEITGLSPAISIDQKTASRNPRSTVATITEVYDYLRVMFARIGRPHSPLTGAPISKMSNDEIVDVIKKNVKKFEKENKGKDSKNKKEIMGVSWDETAIHIYAPIVRGRKGEYYQMLYDALGEGYLHARIDGRIKNLRDRITLAKHKKHDIDLLVDELYIHEMEGEPEDFSMRLAEGIERALGRADGLVRVVIGAPSIDTKVITDDMSKSHDMLLSAKLISPEDGFSFPEIEPRLFSFNSPYGACEACKGLGKEHLFGDDNDDACEVCKGARLRREAQFIFLGSPELAEKYRKKLGLEAPEYVTQSSFPDTCFDKNGVVKKKHTWTPPGLNLYEFINLSIADAHEFVLELDLSDKDMKVAGILLNEIEARIQFMLNVGLNYLSLSRRANTLSGGEAQRIRLASQLGSKLVGALYVLDEPTIGLHERDNERLISTLTSLRDAGNTIIVVEHDEEVALASDYIIDIGPGAGRHGGHVTAMGYLQPLLEAKEGVPNSATLSYLRGEKKIEVPQIRRRKEKGKLVVKGGRINNIKDLSIEVPLGRMVGITGVSGSGKSSFLYKILYTNLRAQYDRKYRSAKVYNAGVFEGDKSVSRVILVDQAPIGRTPRSNPATYTGAWTHIRDLFASTAEAKIRGWKPNRFSFNVKGGRCETCAGRGEIAVEMHFLPTVYVGCDVCHGKRFERETLQVEYKGKNISQILEMTIEESYEFFKDIPSIHDRLSALMETGLGYIKLGQPANTLSGGESQRVKISSELYRPQTQKTVYLLDEPTVGLHFADVQKLIEILNRLVDKGNSVILIEHNMDIIKSCDHLIDFGPEGGVGGGMVVAKGTPEEVSQSKNSHTGRFLKKYL